MKPMQRVNSSARISRRWTHAQMWLCSLGRGVSQPKSRPPSLLHSPQGDRNPRDPLGTLLLETPPSSVQRRHIGVSEQEMTSWKPIVWLEKAPKLLCCFKRQHLGSPGRKDKALKKTAGKGRMCQMDSFHFPTLCVASRTCWDPSLVN